MHISGCQKFTVLSNYIFETAKNEFCVQIAFAAKFHKETKDPYNSTALELITQTNRADHNLNASHKLMYEASSAFLLYALIL